MKKIIFLFALSLSLMTVACKNSEEKTETAETETVATEQAESFPLYRGEFIYQKGAEAGVLMGSDFIYGVALDDKARELADQVAPVKNDSTDMVPVVVRGVVSKNPAMKNPGEVWEEIITIKEIIAVSDKPAKADIKIEETKN
ncbi:MAG: hypothetical protein AAFP76_07750 [Bacteroidota bacterium]